MPRRRRKRRGAPPGAHRRPWLDRAEEPTRYTARAAQLDTPSAVDLTTTSVPCARWYVPGEETPDLEQRVPQNQGDASEVWLALVVVALLVLALCCLTAVLVTATRQL